MTVSLLVWYIGTAVWGGAIISSARQRRYALPYLSAVLALACAYGFGFLPMLVAVPALLACGASIAERRLPPEARAMLLSGAVEPFAQITGFRFCSICGAGSLRTERCRFCAPEKIP